jgi:uncharacterized repeat protein (TIGR01451 family)
VTKRNRDRNRGWFGRRVAALLGLGALLALAFALPARAATPAQIVLLDTGPAYSPVTVNLPGGGTYGPNSPGHFQLQVTPAGGAPVTRQGFCLDALTPIAESTPYQVSLQTAADDPALGGPAAGQAAWLIQEADNLIAASANPGLEAGAIQVAVWMIMGQADLTTPTSDATLNARAQAIRTLAAGKRPAGPVSISAASSSTCAGAGGTTITVSGTAGASASLAVTAGQGTLSRSQVTFGADGTATATLTSASPGTVQVTVTSNGAELSRAARVPGTADVQQTGFLVPRTYTASVSVTFTNCATPTVRPSQILSPTLKVVKTAPKRLSSGSQIPYVITVRNTGRVLARNVVVTDTIPSGLAYLTSSKRPHQLGNRTVWRLGNLRAGANRTLRIVLQAPVGVVGSRTNRVTVSAAGARTVSAQATTRFTQVSQQRTPAVTG